VRGVYTEPVQRSGCNIRKFSSQFNSVCKIVPNVVEVVYLGAPGEFHHPGLGLGLGLRFRVTVRVSVRVSVRVRYRDRVRERGGEILRERRLFNNLSGSIKCTVKQ